MTKHIEVLLIVACDVNGNIVWQVL